MSKYNIIDLFSGCGGLLDGFLQTGKYYPVASVEWEKRPAETLVKRLEDKWNIADAKDSVIRFDIQRVDELFNGFDDIKYGKHDGLEKLIKNKKVDFIIGGPPCQAYSVAGRVRDKKNMKEDYRNYLFGNIIYSKFNFNDTIPMYPSNILSDFYNMQKTLFHLIQLNP